MEYYITAVQINLETDDTTNISHMKIYGNDIDNCFCCIPKDYLFSTHESNCDTEKEFLHACAAYLLKRFEVSIIDPRVSIKYINKFPINVKQILLKYGLIMSCIDSIGNITYKEIYIESAKYCTSLKTISCLF